MSPDASTGRSNENEPGPARFARPFNRRISPRRHLGQLDRPLAELLEMRRAFGVKLNDILLAACAGGVREFLRERGELPIRPPT